MAYGSDLRLIDFIFTCNFSFKMNVRNDRVLSVKFHWNPNLEWDVKFRIILWWLNRLKKNKSDSMVVSAAVVAAATQSTFAYLFTNNRNQFQSRIKLIYSTSYKFSIQMWLEFRCRRDTDGILSFFKKWKTWHRDKHTQFWCTLSVFCQAHIHCHLQCVSLCLSFKNLDWCHRISIRYK